jgi:hypothetical protein
MVLHLLIDFRNRQATRKTTLLPFCIRKLDSSGGRMILEIFNENINISKCKKLMNTVEIHNS